jgi:predicted RNase H-like HicB family nuclease
MPAWRRISSNVSVHDEQGEQGWIVASIPQVPGVLSQGRTREEARSNVLDALRLMLSPEPGEQGESESVELTIAP